VIAFFRRCLLLVLLVAAPQLFAAEVGCNDASIFGGKLITDVCWTCVVPLRVFGAGHNTDDPAGANVLPGCVCTDGLGVPSFGFSLGMWVPYRLMEVVRQANCLTVFGGTYLGAKTADGRGGNDEGPWGWYSTYDYHVHTYSFPLATMLDLMVGKECNPGGYANMDIIMMTEFDPTALDEELALFVYFETVLFSNPAAAAACSIECGLLSAGKKPVSDQFWWCLGCWGPLYPLTPRENGNMSQHTATSIMAARQLAVKHRRGLGQKTYGTDAMCGGKLDVFVPKEQYKWSNLFPVPEASGRCCHWTGEEENKTGGNRRSVPTTGEDTVHMLWRYTDCCMH
jgi:conjugal transfer pilus assembly protein TraU